MLKEISIVLLIWLSNVHQIRFPIKNYDIVFANSSVDEIGDVIQYILNDIKLNDISLGFFMAM